MYFNYPQIMSWLAVYEGGKVDDPQDPGGRTNRGVTQRVYSAYRRANGRDVRDVYLMSDDEHDAIYREQYWDPVWGDRLPSGVDAAVFDFAVNSGVSRSLKYTQRIVGVSADGVMGNVTMAAVLEYCDKPKGAAQLITKLCSARMAFLQSLRIWTRFKGGWTRRVVGDEPGVQDGDVGVLDRGVMLSRGSSESIPPPKQAAPGKGTGSISIINALVALIRSIFGGQHNAG